MRTERAGTQKRLLYHRAQPILCHTTTAIVHSLCIWKVYRLNSQAWCYILLSSITLNIHPLDHVAVWVNPSSDGAKEQGRAGGLVHRRRCREWRSDASYGGELYTVASERHRHGCYRKPLAHQLPSNICACRIAALRTASASPEICSLTRLFQPLGFIPHLPDLCSTALAHISSIKSSRDKGVFTLSLQTSDLQRIIFTLSDEPRGATDTFLDSLSQYAFSGNVERLFAFDYRPSPSHRGAVYDASAELARWRTSSGAWRVSAVNSAFAVCPAYGPALIVPAAVEDSAAVNAAKSFSAHRLPALAWGSDQSLLVRSGRFTDSDTPIGRAAGRAYLGALGNGPWAALSLEAHPEGSVPLGGADVPLASLSVKVPSVDRIAAAWSALSTLCLQPTSKDDTRFFTDLDASKWPLTVTRFLAAANRVADLLTAKVRISSLNFLLLIMWIDVSVAGARGRVARPRVHHCVARAGARRPVLPHYQRPRGAHPKGVALVRIC